jgi:hypothetical protein
LDQRKTKNAERRTGEDYGSPGAFRLGLHQLFEAQLVGSGSGLAFCV